MKREMNVEQPTSNIERTDSDFGWGFRNSVAADVRRLKHQSSWSLLTSAATSFRRALSDFGLSLGIAAALSFMAAAGTQWPSRLAVIIAWPF
jgi:hypothetical protein